MDKLPHSKKVKRLLERGDRDEAAKIHSARVKSEMEKAKAGEVINLSDLIAAREIFEESPAVDPSSTEQ